MSSSETIDELRQQRDNMQADVNGIQDELMMCQMRVADFESMVLALEEGDKGILIRLAKFMKATEDMETLKKQPEELINNVGALLSESAGYQASLHTHLCDQVETLNGNDAKGLGKGGKTFQQKLNEALATLKE